jgi:pilus assembly protein CpaC
VSSEHLHRALSALVGVALLSLAGIAHAQDSRSLNLEVGEQTTLSAVGVERFSEGVSGIVDIRVTEREFIIAALRPGNTSLLLIYTNGRQIRYRIQVRAPGATDTRPGSVEQRETVRLDLYFVELNESYSHQIGIGFPGTIGGPGVGRGLLTFDFIGTPMDRTPQFTQASLALVNQVLPRIDLAEISGWARLRRQTMVVTANGTPAEFSSGGEVNIIATSGLNIELVRIQYGSVLRMTPRYDPQSGRIEVQIAADLSELTEPTSPGGPPGRRRTELEAVANMEPGQAIIMSGLVSRAEQESQGGLPGLSQIPIVGVLFGTNTHRGEATQNVLFIVPTIVQPVARQQRDYIREALETFQRFSGGIQNVELFEAVPPGYGAPGGGAQPSTGDAQQ